MKPFDRAEQHELASSRYRAEPPLGLSPRQTAHRLNTSISTIYRLLASGNLRALKRGASTLITPDSIKKYEASLPAFESRAAQEETAA